MIKGESKYYLAEKDRRYAIFDIKGNQITPEWFDYIRKDGLVRGQSPYYIAKKDGKYAIFDKDGNMITPEWFDYIWEDGLVNGECDYYIACNKDKCAVYHKSGKKVSEDFSIDYMKEVLKVNFNENLGIVEVRDRNGLYGLPKKSIKSIDFNPVYPFKEEIIDYTKLLNIWK